nr:MAG TPA: Single stranded DNA binding protein [Caudoviricetes sp.]
MNTSFYGRLTRDPEIKTPQHGGNPYTSITVATQVRSKDTNGKNKSVFVNATAFGKSGEILAQYFHKGSRIVVHGEVNDISAWIGNQDGQAHSSVNINITGFDFVDTKAENAQQGQQAPTYGNAGYAAQPPAPTQPAAQPYAAPTQPPASTATGYTMPPAYPAPPAPPAPAAPATPPYAQPNTQGAPF